MASCEDFLILARRDFRTAEVLEKEFPDEDFVGNAAYHLQQAIEKELKGLLLLQGIVPQKVHNIMKIMQTGVSLPEDVSQKLKEIAAAVTLWEENTRYDPYEVIIEKDYKKAKEVYKELYSLFESKLEAIRETSSVAKESASALQSDKEQLKSNQDNDDMDSDCFFDR